MQATIVENASPSAVSSNSARVEDAALSFSELHATKADHNRTWSSLFVVANHSENYSLYQEELVFSNEGVLQIKASEEKISEGEEYWKNSLVGYFIGSRPPFQAIRSQDDLTKVMGSDPQYIHNRLLILCPWDCKPLFLDQLTSKRERIGFAKICIKVPASKELPKSLQIFLKSKHDYTIRIEYDLKPVRNQKSILSLVDSSSHLIQGEQLHEEVIKFYENLLAPRMPQDRTTNKEDVAFCSKLGGLIRQGLFSNAISSGPNAMHLLNSVCYKSSTRPCLSYGTDGQSLREAFNRFGNVVEARVITDRDTGWSRCFGFMNFDNGESASYSIASMAGQE
ncbi:hypothetical protein MUK42_08504 [Musa troglodytarum]|uniref:RRM domain-containing protein n=1 Tax=Musa troglodytarum TaxID=320322 RepID=A0A9E7JAG9_9LILI|nr:hypothetical protein MUK42_08504 [Musa troglodytarum]